MHVFLDLQPYICTFAGCRDMLVTFPSRAVWSEHEFQQHRVKESYKCSDCGQEFGSRDLFIRHLEVDHHLLMNNKQQAAVLSAARCSVAPSWATQQCPLCLQQGWLSRRQFDTHVARHMEEIALASLPRDDEDDGDGSAVDEHDLTHSSPKSEDASSIQLDGPSDIPAINENDLTHSSPKPDNASSIQLEKVSDIPVDDESDCTHPSPSKRNDIGSVQAETASQNSSRDSKSGHWAMDVFLNISVTPLTKTENVYVHQLGQIWVTRSLILVRNAMEYPTRKHVYVSKEKTLKRYLKSLLVVQVNLSLAFTTAKAIAALASYANGHVALTDAASTLVCPSISLSSIEPGHHCRSVRKGPEVLNSTFGQISYSPLLKVSQSKPLMLLN